MKLNMCGTLVFAWLLAGITAFAAEDTFLQEYARTRGFSHGRPVKAKVLPGGDKVLFLRGGPRDAKYALFEYDAGSGQTRELLNSAMLLKGGEEKLSAEEKARRERQRQTGAGFTQYHLDPKAQNILLGLSGKLYLVRLKDLQVRTLNTGKGILTDPKFSPDGKKIAYVLNHDIAVYDLERDVESMVTKGGTPEKTHGIAEFVAQEEMDRFTGYWWSPDSNWIAFEEVDHAGVEMWSIADPLSPQNTAHLQYYPRPGKSNVRVRLGVTSTAGDNITWLEWDKKRYEYLAGVRWDKQGPLTLLVQDRKQQEQALLLADVKSGATRQLLVEKDPAFLNLRQDIPIWLPGSESFLWIAEGNKGWQIQQRAKDGSLLQTLVADRPGLGSVLEFDDKGRVLYFHDCPDGKMPGSQSIFKLDLGNADRKPVVSPVLVGDGVISGSISADGTTLVASRADMKEMPATVVIRNGKEVGKIPTVAVEPPFIPQVLVEKVGAGDGFWTAVVKPRNFDPSKKYPVIVDVYGGPHHLTITPTLRHWFLMQWLADQGFIVVATDNRGTPGRGRDWERAVYGKFGSVPLEDQVLGLQALAKLHPQMDLARVGVVGWSFGGYMSAQALLKRPDVFKAGVAGAPVTSWEDYDTHYTERYMGLLPENQKEYDAGSLLPLAKNLQGRLLLVHGTADDNVYFRHTLRLAQSLFQEGREFDMLPLPGLTHMVPGALETERLWNRIAGYFKKHL